MSGNNARILSHEFVDVRASMFKPTMTMREVWAIQDRRMLPSQA